MGPFLKSGGPLVNSQHSVSTESVFVKLPHGYLTRTSLVAQRLKRLPAMQETRARSLGGEDPLEKEMVTHSGIIAWEIPWTEKPGRLPSMASQKSWTRLSD